MSNIECFISCRISRFIDCELEEVEGDAEKLRESESRLILLHLGFDPLKKTHGHSS